MKKVLIMPALVTALFATACGSSPTEVDTSPGVRFFNATTGMTGNGGFEINGQFVPGSELPYGESTQACSRLEPGSTSFAFGISPGPAWQALATLSNQTIASGANVIVAAAGSAASPTLFLLDNDSPGSLNGNQAAIRFVNLASAASNPFNVLAGTVGSGPTSVVATNITVGVPTTYAIVPSGSATYTILHGHVVAITGSEAMLNLPARSMNTIAIVSSGSGGFGLVNIPRCS